MLSQFGEASDDQQVLTFRGGIHFFVLQDPCVAMWDKCGVHARSKRRIDI